MAKRPSVQEILEAARRGTPPAPRADEPPADEPPARLSLQEKLEKADAERDARVASREAASDAAEPADPGKPSIREKLERARAAHPIREAAPRDDAPEAEPEEEAEAEAEAREEAAAVPTPPPPPAAGGKKMTLQEKLAAARGGSAPSAVAPEPPAASAAKPAGGAKPMTVAEKLAAARANKAAPIAAPTAAAATVAVVRELPPIAEINEPKEVAEALRRAGAEREAGLQPSGRAPAGPRAPFTPPPRPVETPIETPPGSQLRVDRRGFLLFLSWSGIAWSALVAALALLSWMFVRFLFPNAEAEPPSTVKVGFPTDYEPGEVNERFKDRWGFWVVRDVDERGRDVIYALQTYCTHLGCPPTWLANEHKFKCPCHGSGFYKDGVHFEGPAPRPLERYKVALADDGQIVIDKAQTFRKELGQWDDPDSFLAV